MSVTVRPATRADIDALVRFNMAMAAETEDKGLDESTLKRGIETLMANPVDGHYLIAERNAEVAGTLMVTYEWSDWRCGRFHWIQSVYVAAEHRRQGVYQALHDTVRRAARDTDDCCGIRLYVERDNTTAQTTYLNLGMVKTDYKLFEEVFKP
ncbi:MAG: GNAT family N-acetyltransferase [Pseudomonadaceae bacterium]|nr:GNAT family N-acetyltransferase [Pseudomonadaceae bacterium]